MNEFLSILTHGRRLQGAVKDLSVAELEEVLVKFKNIIETRKLKEEKKRQEEHAKKEKIKEIQKQLVEAGISYEELSALAQKSVSKRVGQKRPVKYKLTDADGEVHHWTGIGRMPKVFQDEIEKGQDLEAFRI